MSIEDRRLGQIADALVAIGKALHDANQIAVLQMMSETDLIEQLYTRLRRAGLGEYRIPRTEREEREWGPSTN